MENCRIKSYIICELKDKLKHELKKNDDKLHFLKTANVNCTEPLSSISDNLCNKFDKDESTIFDSICNEPRKMCEKRYPKLSKLYQHARCHNKSNKKSMDCNKIIKHKLLDATILQCIK
ncbi:PREDICTED: uncharacterized protein LOC105368672 [Ceratosolen solmsi marchali]|uniref:Uncharacterized protein LOC105368672 n=1 Tax=Ceratosolen solmsi marchali TaxID=326594 RepID=A0AAJ6YX41_9HYME|nr:PREDICTED: uncharacterized protein LOC105368672 [Ceratosolen solmsi marchali]